MPKTRAEERAELRKKVAELHVAGLTGVAIAARIGRSQPFVRQLLHEAELEGIQIGSRSASRFPREPPPPSCADQGQLVARCPIPSPPDPCPEDLKDLPPMTLEELRAWVSTFMRKLERAYDVAESSGDMTAADRCRRSLASIAPLAARIAIKDDDGEGVVRVELAEIESAAHSVRQKLHDLVSRCVDSAPKA